MPTWEAPGERLKDALRDAKYVSIPVAIKVLSLANQVFQTSQLVYPESLACKKFASEASSFSVLIWEDVELTRRLSPDDPIDVHDSAEKFMSALQNALDLMQDEVAKSAWSKMLFSDEKALAANLKKAEDQLRVAFEETMDILAPPGVKNRTGATGVESMGTRTISPEPDGNTTPTQTNVSVPSCLDYSNRQETIQWRDVRFTFSGDSLELRESFWADVAVGMFEGHPGTIRRYRNERPEGKKYFNQDLQFLKRVSHPNFPRIITSSPSGTVAVILIDPERVYQFDEFLLRLCRPFKLDVVPDGELSDTLVGEPGLVHRQSQVVLKVLLMLADLLSAAEYLDKERIVTSRIELWIMLEADNLRVNQDGRVLLGTNRLQAREPGGANMLGTRASWKGAALWYYHISHWLEDATKPLRMWGETLPENVHHAPPLECVSVVKEASALYFEDQSLALLHGIQQALDTDADQVLRTDWQKIADENGPEAVLSKLDTIRPVLIVTEGRIFVNKQELAWRGILRKRKWLAWGKYGSLYKCAWDIPDDVNPRKLPVAVRVLRESDDAGSDERFMKYFNREIRAWREADHKNLLPLLGVVIRPELSFVSPWCKNGNVVQYSKNQPQWKLFTMVCQIACGLTFLHNFDPQVVHGDIKPEKILIRDDGQAAIADFGLARVIGDRKTGGTTAGCSYEPVRFMAPETFTGDGAKTAASDVYAFGMLAVQIHSGLEPYYKATSDTEIINAMMFGPPIGIHDYPAFQSTAGLLKLWYILAPTWERAPDARPSMATLSGQFDALGAEGHFAIPTSSNDEACLMARMEVGQRV